MSELLHPAHSLVGCVPCQEHVAHLVDRVRAAEHDAEHARLAVAELRLELAEVSR